MLTLLGVERSPAGFLPLPTTFPRPHPHLECSLPYAHLLIGANEGVGRLFPKRGMSEAACGGSAGSRELCALSRAAREAIGEVGDSVA